MIKFTNFLLLTILWTLNLQAESFALVGDAGMVHKDSARVRDSIVKTGTKNVILLGDNNYDPKSSYEKIWDSWKHAGLNFKMVAIGNHSLSYAAELKYFGFEKEYYSLVDQKARFIVLNSDNDSSAKEQAAFLETELEKSKEKLVFLIFHHPPVSLTKRHPWQEKQAFHTPVRALINKYKTKISAILVGHDHVASLAEINEVPIVVSGATFDQGNPENTNTSDGLFNIKTHWTYRKDPHWAKLETNSANGSAKVDFIHAKSGVAVCSAQIFPRPISLKENCAKKSYKDVLKN